MTTEPTKNPGDLLRQALLQIRELKARVAAAESARAEPIAIVGVGLRLPGGVEDAAGFAKLLWGGVDAVGEIPAERWSAAALRGSGPGDTGRTIRHGAFLRGLDRFDAEFFGISPREAESLDPQQRLLLEVGWEALENANQPPRGLSGSSTGVYVGMAASDYGREVLSDREALDAYASSGAAYGTAVGRLSYFLGLQGPSIAIDTACSSSLVAVHLAVQGLRLGECDLALTGGVNVILSPEPTLVFSRAQMLAPDGRCRSFSADANGYVRGEGCAMIVLRKLSDAQARGDRILGVIRGSATNQDGRSAGLTAPNGLAQEAVIAAALKAGGVDPLQISYVEAHGSGTPLGDPIEVGALGAALCAGRPADQPLTIGSVKTNVGHLESAAGIAGLIKVLLAFEKGEIPANLHFAAGNPHIDWTGLPIRVPTKAEPWQPTGGRRLAGVSSFGFGGSNAHVVLEAPPATTARVGPPDRPVQLLVLSARDDEALGELGQRYLGLLETPGAALADICHGAAAGRSHFAHRLALVGTTADEVGAALRAALAEGPRTSPVAKVAPVPHFRIAAPHPDDAAAIETLRRTSPTFAAGFEAVAAQLRDPAAPAARHLALQHGLAALWRSWGVGPARVTAQAGGELAAAAIAGLIPLQRAIAIVQGEEERPASVLEAVSTLPDPDALGIRMGSGAQPWGDILASLGDLYRAGVEIDWTGFDRDYPRTPLALPTYPFRRRRYWARQVRAFARPSQVQASAHERFLVMNRLTKAAPGERRRLIIEQLRAMVASARPVGGAQPLASDVSLAKAGIDVMSIELRQRIESAFGRPLTPMLLLNYQTLNELADYLLGILELTGGQESQQHRAVSHQETLSDEVVRSRLLERLAQLK